ncbi:hypothetical protein Btru_066195 [Bulinus truncatus]|nr:hypothetical protein Btru_066195 [Bulinus truncatus]
MNYSTQVLWVDRQITSNSTGSVFVVSIIGVVSQAVLDIVLLVNLDVLGEIVGLVGIVANVVNVHVFVKQGFRDTVNISLTALALSDIGALVTLQLYNVMVNPWFAQADLPFVPLEVQSLTAFYPHNYFSRVRGFITAFVTLERCLCVAWPLKIKQVLTKRVSLVCNVIIYLLMIANVSPNYIMTYYDWKFVKSRNKTLYGILYRPNKDVVFGYTFFVTDFFVPLFAFFIVVICTIVIVVTLRSKALWRQSVSSGSGDGSEKGIPSKERKVMLMITAVSVIFIVCFIPFSAILTARALVPGMSINGPYWNLVLLVGSVAFFMETINSSISFVIYFKMSSKFRVHILEIFGWMWVENKEKWSKSKAFKKPQYQAVVSDVILHDEGEQNSEDEQVGEGEQVGEDEQVGEEGASEQGDGGEAIEEDVATCGDVSSYEACEYGWYGEGCTIRCNCGEDDNCDESGHCVESDNQCAKGWFGEKCQQIDAMQFASVTVPVLADNDHDTCLENMTVKTVNVTLAFPVLFTYLAIVVMEDGRELMFRLGRELMFRLGRELMFRLARELMFRLGRELMFRLGRELMFRLGRELMFRLGRELMSRLGRELMFRLSRELMFRLGRELMFRLGRELMFILGRELMFRLPRELMFRLGRELMFRLGRELMFILGRELMFRLARELMFRLARELMFRLGRELMFRLARELMFRLAES